MLGTKKIFILYGLEAASGGALKHLIYLATSLDRNIFAITVILSKRSTDIEESIHDLKAHNINVVVMSMCRNISLFKDLYIVLKVAKYIHKNKVDIVHAHSSKAGFYFRLAGWLNNVKYIIYTPHCFYFQSKNGFKRKFFVLTERVLSLITTKIIVSENEMRECLLAKVSPTSKLVNINNAIKFEDYSEHDKISSLNFLQLTQNAIIVGTVARLEKQKDIITLIKAANRMVKKNADLYFIIAGAGELQDLIRQEINKYSLAKRVFLLGHLNDIGKVMTAFDVFVSTSLWEGLPYALLEAMWYKKPVIATNLGYGDIMNDIESDCLIPPGNVKILCEKLQVLLNDQQLRQRIGERNHRKIINNYSFEKFVNLHQLLYRQVSLYI